MEAAGGVERLDCDHTTAFMPEHPKPADADTMGRHELRSALPQERTIAVLADLNAPYLAAEQAHNESHSPGTVVTVQVPSKLVGDALQNVASFQKPDRLAGRRLRQQDLEVPRDGAGGCSPDMRATRGGRLAGSLLFFVLCFSFPYMKAKMKHRNRGYIGRLDFSVSGV